LDFRNRGSAELDAPRRNQSEYLIAINRNLVDRDHPVRAL
jgi:hypothetical protein